MFTLQKLNVIRIVETEEQKARLIKQGFIEIVERIESEVEKSNKEVVKTIKSKSKSK